MRHSLWEWNLAIAKTRKKRLRTGEQSQTGCLRTQKRNEMLLPKTLSIVPEDAALKVRAGRVEDTSEERQALFSKAPV